MYVEVKTFIPDGDLCNPNGKTCMGNCLHQIFNGDCALGLGDPIRLERNNWEISDFSNASYFFKKSKECKELKEVENG